MKVCLINLEVMFGIAALTSLVLKKKKKMFVPNPVLTPEGEAVN